jgi:hypothetical protein
MVKLGEEFTAPEGYVPSRHLRACNEEAKVALEELQAKLIAEAKVWVKKAEETKSEKKKDQAQAKAESLEDLALHMVTEIWQKPVEGPSVKKVMTPQQVDDLRASEKRPVGKRVADSR